MLPRRHRCLKLVQPNPAFHMHSFDIRPLGNNATIQTTKIIYFGQYKKNVCCSANPIQQKQHFELWGCKTQDKHGPSVENSLQSAWVSTQEHSIRIFRVNSMFEQLSMTLAITVRLRFDEVWPVADIHDLMSYTG